MTQASIMAVYLTLLYLLHDTGVYHGGVPDSAPRPDCNGRRPVCLDPQPSLPG